MLCYSSFGSQGHNARTLEPKVVAPRILAGIEESNKLPCFLVDRGNIAALESIANETCPGEVVAQRFSTMLPRDNVIGFVR
jgi:hypothetical protein